MLFCRNEISTSLAGTNFILRLHGEINFHPGKVGQGSTLHLFTNSYRFPLIQKCSQNDEIL